MTYELTGKGIGVAVLDTGIFAHMDFGSRIKGFYDAINGKSRPYDDNGHGSHVAGIIAGSGRASGGRYVGIAPEANLIGVKILDFAGKGNMQDAIAGVRWVISHRHIYNIRIANISFISDVSMDNAYENPLLLEVERMWDMGIVVVTAAGNNGPECGSIGIPGISRRIITVGAYDKMFGLDEEGRLVRRYSGLGPCDCQFIKPEIVARGADVISCTNRQGHYAKRSGSSMATPYVSGMIARLLEKYPDMKPVDVKLRLHRKAIKVSQDIIYDGWGTIDDSFL